MIVKIVTTLCVVALYKASLTLGQEQEFQRVARDLHNLYRIRHHANSLNSSADLNNRAIQCAQYYATRGTIDHSCPYKNGAGENLWSSWGRSISDLDAARTATDMWYSEVSQHNYNGDWQPGSGHFSQLVWKGSREIGFGTGRSSSLIVGCALYSPHGNIIGQFRSNVSPP